MKTKIHYCLYAIFILSLSITLTMCKKKEKDLNKQDSSLELTQRDQKILNLVKNFKANLNARFKDDEKMVVDSVIWYLESTLNVYYCRLDTFEKTYIDSTFITIPLASTNLVHIADVDTAYLNLVDSLRSHYHNAPFKNKNILFVDIYISNTNNNSITVEMLDCIGDDTQWILDPTFNNTDYWYWAYGYGKCGDYQGGSGLDAASELNQYANAWIFDKAPMSCYTDIVSVGPIHPSDDGTTNLDSPCYEAYYLFQNGHYDWLDPQECISPDCMNYYLNGLLTVEAYYQQFQSGRDLIHISCHYDWIDWGNGQVRLHKAWFSYGYPIAIPFQPIRFN